MKKNDRKNPFQCTNEEALAAYEKSISRGDKPMHTPTPWKLEHDEEALASYVMPGNKDAGYVAQCAYSVAGISEEEARANAAFIVTACNAHEDFINVLKATLEDFAAERLIGDPETVEATIEQIKKALAKAGVKVSA